MSEQDDTPPPALDPPKLRPYDGRWIANYFIRLARADGKKISLDRLLKLVYLAHGWTMAHFDSPLVNDNFEAWTLGPVSPTIFHAYRPQGHQNISPVEIYEERIPIGIKVILTSTYDAYNNYSDADLVKLTVAKNSPWYNTFQKTGKFSPIPNSLIKSYYRDIMEQWHGN